MTIDEFNKTRFGAGMEVIYKGEQYPIVAVEFEEALIAIPYERGVEVEVADQMSWVRCENCTLVDNDEPSVPS